MPVFTRQQLLKAVSIATLDPDREPEITKVERTLGVKFPITYRAIIGLGGEGHMGPVKLASGHPLHFNFLPMERERHEYVSMRILSAHRRILKSEADLQRVVPFGACGNGDMVCFDYRASSLPPIVLWDHESAFSSPDPLRPVADSFDALVAMALDEKEN